VPNGALPKTKIMATIQRHSMLKSYTSPIPTLSFCAMRPDDADIFLRIKEDDVRGVEGLLEQGFASLSDCDRQGNPLVYVRGPSASVVPMVN